MYKIVKMYEKVYSKKLSSSKIDKYMEFYVCTFFNYV